MAASVEGTRVLRCAEFYSGVGGWAYGARAAAAALSGASGSPVAVEMAFAIDVSTTCNDVYSGNFGGRKPSQRRIEDLDPSVLEGLDGWLMSPPCQPHTRQRDRGTDDTMDAADPRSASFLWLCERLERCEKPPDFVCLENVVGFAGWQQGASLSRLTSWESFESH